LEHGSTIEVQSSRIAESIQGARITASDSVTKTNMTALGNATALAAQHPLATTSWWSLLRFTISFTLVIKFLCIASNVVLQASPFPLVN
jgi:hypothetical protein